MILVIIGIRTEEHSLRSQVGIGSVSDCLFGQLDRILDISSALNTLSRCFIFSFHTYYLFEIVLLNVCVFLDPRS